MRDFRWQQNGGVLLDGSGDFALSSADGRESLYDMIRSRLKAAVNGWRLYQIGAGLQDYIGRTVDLETELAIKRSVARALQLDFLQQGTFQVETIAVADIITIFVYLNAQLVAQATLNEDGTVTVE